MTKSPHQSLHAIFETNITVNHISEKLKSCNSDEDTKKAKRIMDENNFDCLGVTENNRVIGYIEKDQMREGKVQDYVIHFRTEEIVSEYTSLISTLYLLEEHKRLFILEGNRITKIVTSADLQKPPVQLLLYGLVSLVEMYLVKLIKQFLPNESWQSYLKPERLQNAKKVFAQRKEMDEEIELVDCLQLCDKREIVKKNEELLRLFQFPSKSKFDSYLKNLEELRDNLAHAQEYMNNFTIDEIISLVKQTEIFLVNCEKAVMLK